MYKIPVLFETYIRTDTSRKVWEQIKKIKPQSLYFYSNKALENHPEDIEKNNEIRSWIQEIDWSCDVHTFFRDKQVDQYTSLISSKRWLFENEERGVIIEDDCVPSHAFFQFCEYFLEKYKNEKTISFISGNNYSQGFKISENQDHIITRSQLHFGWATWKDRWDNFDLNLSPSDVINANSFEIYYPCFYMRWYYKIQFKKLEQFINDTKCWDYIWTLNDIKNNSYVVNPIKNLVRNIGYYGEHAKGKDSYMFHIGSMNENYIFVKNEIQRNLIPAQPTNPVWRIFGC